MSEAPERIWMDPTSEDEDGFFVVEAEKRCGNMDIEYVRADMVTELVEALLEARKELQECSIELTGEDYNSPQINAAIAKAKGKSDD